MVNKMEGKCHKCSKTFDSSAKLLLHKTKNCKPKICNDCGSSFTEVRSLNYHLKNRELIRCDHCDGKLCNNELFQRLQRSVQKVADKTVGDLDQYIYPNSEYENKAG